MPAPLTITLSESEDLTLRELSMERRRLAIEGKMAQRRPWLYI